MSSVLLSLSLRNLHFMSSPKSRVFLSPVTMKLDVGPVPDDMNFLHKQQP